MTQELDTVATYGRALGWDLQPRTVLVEGTTDVSLFNLARRLEREKTGTDLFADGLTIIAAGVGDQGGTRGVNRELIRLQGYARTYLQSNGRPHYRFIGLFDNDKAGREAVKGIRNFDTSILEYKDVFRLRPVMPRSGNRDPKTLKKSFERLNADFKGFDWELEDLLAEQFLEAFIYEYANAVVNTTSIKGRVHRDLTRDGKDKLQRYVHENAIWEDLCAVIDVLRAIRFYLCLP